MYVQDVWNDVPSDILPQPTENFNKNSSNFAESIEEKQNIYSDEFKELAEKEPVMQL